MKKETIEEALNREFPLDKSYEKREAMFVGIKWQQERSYSEEEVLRIIQNCKNYLSFGDEFNEVKWFEQFKK